MDQMQLRLKDFIAYVQTLSGDEKGEAQVFCDRLFRAFGWPGYKEAGATLEERVAVVAPGKKKTKKFIDLLWPSKLLIEMKSRDIDLSKHYQQAFEYWQHIVPHRPRWVILCNFDEFWIYDFDQQLYEPVDKVPTDELVDRYDAFGFLLVEPKKPLFGNDRIAVTREAADRIATLFNHLTKRGIKREQAQRFVLQCVVCLFAEDIGLLPKSFFTALVDECVNGASSFDLIGDLFRWMNSKEPPDGGRYKGVKYFNGGLFAKVEPIELTKEEIALLALAATENWAKVQPPIFGTLFQGSMDQDERHALGAHFTSEADIQKVVLPTIVRPWRERVTAAKTKTELLALRRELEKFQVLDPACGSGNFLYVAYRELVRIEMELVNRLREEFHLKKGEVPSSTFLSIKQFHGIDINDFAVELAKVTLLLGKKLAYDEVSESQNVAQLGLQLEDPLPLDNLDDHILKRDALFAPWPKCDAIIGNPPYQSKNKMQAEFGAAYVNRVRKSYPGVPGRADYCVYWFRKAHDHLEPGTRAGLVGTNTIRQNYSRQGGLDYIVQNGGTITDAVSTQVWPGLAVVHVSIVNWVKGKAPGKKRLMWQQGDAVDSPWSSVTLDVINTALSPKQDVTQAVALRANAESGACYQGITHGHEGFILSVDEAAEMMEKDPANRKVLFPYLIGQKLVGVSGSQPDRFVIDFHPRSMHDAATFKAPFAVVKAKVLPTRQDAAKREEQRNEELREEDPTAKGNKHHRIFLDQWWLLSWPRPELVAKLKTIPRYIACPQVTKRPIFEFISSKIRPNAALLVFPLPDDYSFGILASGIHWQWFNARCSTLKGDFRYTSDTVFDSFPWPQEATKAEVKAVAKAAVELRKVRGEVIEETRISLRDLYRQLEEPGKSPVRAAHEELDEAVRKAYGMKASADPLAFLLDLNLSLGEREENGQPIVGPGLPLGLTMTEFVTDDCVPAPKL